ncbi:hypothetical protein [Oceanobacillus profundus]|uniref:Uncharacterized protein n=1 Tax=Oceanobacillus profundus TaxID=372463 RepID=A0A417YGG9_9BACI|nr:hypothetical protein [Oceanobacillus profundus]MBR2246095.1 hypothetical protein [Bacilli bacterium]MBR3119766.1 hypothetical protein [Oceanobacillus sp.]RHW31917.1 hypothetical protein D1B32_11805 [Oceanobacillus profundus]
MRNVLIFPEGYEIDFMYPKDKDLEVDLELEVKTNKGLEKVKIFDIKIQGNSIYYYLQYVN